MANKPIIEAVDEYIDTVIGSTTTSFGSSDVENDDADSQDSSADEQEVDRILQDVSAIRYYTSSNLRRFLFLVTSAFAIVTTIWHILFFVGVDHPYLSGTRFVASHFILLGTLLFLSTFSTDSDDRVRYAYNLYSVLMIALIWIGGSYVFLYWDTLPQRAGLPTQMDVYISTILVLVTLEGVRRVMGRLFVGLGAVTLAYGLFGNFIPGTFGHSGLSYERLITGVAVPDLNGIFGFFLDISATLIVLFIFFGMFLLHLGGSEFFSDFAMKIAGGARSGPAQVAIISSGLMGMLSGVAIANVAATGSFTIPLMKKLGYDKEFAGAIESVASSGGQITPPIMGAAAFVMASIIGVGFVDIVFAAVIPATLYYLTLMLTAHIRAVRKGFESVPTEMKASYSSILIRSYLFIPILLIIYSLIQGAPALIAGWQGLQALIVLYVAHLLLTHYDDLYAGLKKVVVTLAAASDSASRTMAALMIIIAELAWIIEVFTMTGIIQKFAAQLLYIAGGDLFLLAILVAVVSVALGFGMPTLVAYLFVALMAAPVLVDFGINPIAAHLFVFYYAILSAISPPVAGACLVACGISGGEFVKTCKYAIRFAIPAYLLPFLWLYNPAVIGMGSPGEIAIAVTTALLGIVLFVSAIENFLLTQYTRTERAVALATGLILLVPRIPLSTVLSSILPVDVAITPGIVLLTLLIPVAGLLAKQYVRYAGGSLKSRLTRFVG
jgi:TRAP transporter 4TM/12TM fusion protein